MSPRSFVSSSAWAAATVAAFAVLLSASPLALVAAEAQAPGRRVIQRVIVKVNGEIFTQTDLEQRQVDALREKNPQLQSASQLQDEALRAEVLAVTPAILANAVDELLLLQRGRELGYAMTDEQFKRLVENVKTENKLDDKQLEQALAQEGMTMTEWRRVAERQVIIQNVQGREIMSRTTLTEAEQKAYYDANQALFLTPATVTLREIFVAVPTETQGGQTVVNAAVQEAAKAKIDAARERLVKGEDVAAVVAEVSESGSKANGGLVGPVNLGEIDPGLRGVLEKLKTGEISESFRSTRGYQVFKLESRTEALPRPYNEVKDEVYQRIMQGRVEGETKKYLDGIRGAALIEWKDEGLRKLYEQHRSQSPGGRP